jgi:hypothetical protein
VALVAVEMQAHLAAERGRLELLIQVAAVALARHLPLVVTTLGQRAAPA